MNGNPKKEAKNMKEIQYNHSAKSQGFSLVELMISLLLGTFLLALTMNLFFGTKQTEKLATTVLETQTEARNAMHVIRQAIEHAGYTTQVQSDEAKQLTFAPTAQFAAGQVLRVLEDGDEQRLLVRLQGDDTILLRACDGSAIKTDTNGVQTSYEFYLENEQLLCQVYENGIATNDAIVLGDGITAFKLRAFSNVGNTVVTRVSMTTPISSEDIIKGVQVQLVIKSQQPIRASDRATSISLTGFAAKNYNDRFYYVDAADYFLAKNQ